MRARRVVGTLALVAVREQQHDARALAPLLLGRRDELVDDGLRAVGEVAELGLPQHERVGALDRVAVLEAHRRVLAEQRVVDPELRLVVGEVRERQPLLAVHRGRAARRGAARRCRGGCPGRRGAPGCPRAAASRARAARRSPSRSLPLRLMSKRFLSSCCSFGCTVKPAGLLSNASPIACTTSVGDAGGLELARDDLVGSRVDSVAPMIGIDAGLRGVRLGEGALEAVLEVAVRLLVLLLGDVAASDERLGVELADRALRLDEVVHERLRHRGVVALVVAAAAVADEVDDDVALELLAVARTRAPRPARRPRGRRRSRGRSAPGWSSRHPSSRSTSARRRARW